MYIVAADDEPLALKMLTQSIQEACPTAQVNAFQKASDVLQFLKDNPCDVAFLDIHMRGTTGLTLAKKIKELNPKCNLIFVTGFSHYAAEAMALHASGYVIKPVDADKIRRELSNLRHPIAPLSGSLLKLSCFGTFEVFSPGGELIRFSRAKSKELLAYLAYRKGSSCAIRELAAILFEDQAYSAQQMAYLQKIISAMMKTLKEYGADGVITKSYNAISLNTDLVDCDYYRFLQMDVAAINAYAGEFMAQYSWAEFMAGYLDRMSLSAAGEL